MSGIYMEKVNSTKFSSVILDSEWLRVEFGL